jgi:ketosteroid isomerase-like protein
VTASTPSSHVDVLRRAFAGVSAGDADQMLANYTDDMVLELPYSDPPMTLRSKAEVHGYLAKAFQVFKFHLDITDVYETTDPDVLVAEYSGEGQVTTTGKPYNNSYIGVYRFRDGLISWVREFYNPIVSVRALSKD